MTSFVKLFNHVTVLVELLTRLVSLPGQAEMLHTEMPSQHVIRNENLRADT
jgi:hypothetical protein